MNQTKLLADLNALKINVDKNREQIEKLSLEIATANCPLSIGDKIKIIDYKEKSYEGEIMAIDYFYKSIVDRLFHTVNVNPTWEIRGKRVKKSNGQLGKWSFSANPVYFQYDHNTQTFIEHKNSLEILLDTI